MELADVGSPDGLADAIMSQVPDMPIPVPVEEIARQLDITEIGSLTTKGFAGALLTNAERSEGKILINENSRRPKKRFTIGHELGHFLCSWHVPLSPDGFYCSEEDMRAQSSSQIDRAKRMEIEANRFSAQLLMPLASFRRDIRNRGDASLEVIIELAGRYDISKESTARRYVEMHDEPCAAIISRHGKIKRIYRHELFPFIEPGFGSPLPQGSLSAQEKECPGAISSWNEADAAEWLPSGRGDELPVVYEQVHYQADGYRLTLLTAEIDEDEIEAEDLEDSWTPRFKR